MKKIIITLFIFFYSSVFGQEYNLKNKYFLWTFHTQNTTINGVSVGAFPNISDTKRFVRTNGIRLEIPGFGFLALMGNGSPVSNRNPEMDSSNDKFDEIINGINISTGTLDKVNYNGITLAGMVQFGQLNNGLAVAGIWNAMNKSNGVQIAFLLNEAVDNNGLQIAFGNSAVVSHGIQIGASNYSETMYGLQIGVFNKTTNSKGLQIGCWNINEKRQWPIFNWNF